MGSTLIVMEGIPGQTAHEQLPEVPEYFPITERTEQVFLGEEVDDRHELIEGEILYYERSNKGVALKRAVAYFARNWRSISQTGRLMIHKSIPDLIFN